MRIGVTGYKGRLGSQLVHMGCEPITAWIREGMPEINFPVENAAVINCAALTDVDRCETDKDYYERAIQTNALAIHELAKVYKGKIIHISTDYVFRGKRGAYKEDYWRNDDMPTKGMGYGLTKMAAEFVVKEYENVKIVRTTGLYGGISPSDDFLNILLGKYESVPDYKGFEVIPDIFVTKELHGNQTYIPHLAEALIKYTELKDKPKVLHIASKEVITRYEFALMIASTFGLDKRRIKPCKNKDVPGWIAERPKKSGLKVDLAIKMGLPIYTILEGLNDAKKQQDIGFNEKLRGTTDWLQETFERERKCNDE